MISAEGGCGGTGSLEKSFSEALCREGLRQGEEVVLVDEMRVGLLGQSRWVWGKRGETVRQRVEL